MRFRICRKRSRFPIRRGAATVEMALAVPILFVLVFGIFEFGQAFLIQHLLQNAAREGCRAGVLPNSTNAAVLDSVQKALQAKGIVGTTTTILVNNTAGDVAQAKAGDNISVQINFPAAQMALVPRSLITGSLTANCARRRE